MRELKVNFGTHIVDRAHESLGILIEVGSEHEIGYLQVKVVTGIDI